MRDIDSNHCASLASVDLKHVRLEIIFLKEEIIEKAQEKETAATFELGQLCQEYGELLKRYEHLYAMDTAYELDKIIEEKKQNAQH